MRADPRQHGLAPARGVALGRAGQRLDLVEPGGDDRPQMVAFSLARRNQPDEAVVDRLEDGSVERLVIGSAR